MIKKLTWLILKINQLYSVYNNLNSIITNNPQIIRYAHIKKYTLIISSCPTQNLIKDYSDN